MENIYVTYTSKYMKYQAHEKPGKKGQIELKHTFYKKLKMYPKYSSLVEKELVLELVLETKS